MNETLQSEDETTTMGVVPYDGMLKNFEAAASVLGSNATPFLKCQKGDFLLGADLEEILIGTRCAINLQAATWGWVRWDDGRPVERRMVSMASGQSRAFREDLGHNDRALWEVDTEGKPRDPWSLNFEIPLREVAGEKREMILTGSSRGLESAVHDLLKAFVVQARGHEGAVPIVELQTDRYMHRVYGVIKTPKLPIVAWLGDATRDKRPSKARARKAGAKSQSPAIEDELSDELPF